MTEEHSAPEPENKPEAPEKSQEEKPLPKPPDDDAPLMQRSVFDWIRADSDESALHQTITAEEVAVEHGIPERHLTKYLQAEIKEAEACKSLPFTVVLVVSYSIMAVAHDDAITIRAIEEGLKHDIVENANFAFTGDYIGHKTIDDVNSFADFWSWIRIGLIPLLFQQSVGFHEGYDLMSGNQPNYTVPNITIAQRGYWLHFNRIIGGLRLSQERDDPDGGELCTTTEPLRTLYNAMCVGGLEYVLEPELGLPNERAQHTLDPQREEWLYIFDDIDLITDKLIKLELSSWLDRDTKKIEIVVASYNAEFGVHTLTRINFYFSRGGHIWKMIIPASQYADWHDRWYYGVYDGIWLLCITYIFIAEIIEVQAIFRAKGMTAIILEYLNVWNFIDWLAVVGGMVILMVFFVSIGMRNALNDALINLGNFEWEQFDSAAYKSQIAEYYVRLEQNANYVRYLRLSLSIYPLFIVIRLFKSFAAQPKLALVTQTLKRAAPDLFHFMIVFFSVFVTFTICAIVLFGREVRSFTTMARAFVSTFRVMLGDFDWDELSTIGRLEAQIWLWVYLIFVVLIMLNMILAIVMDNYEIVKSEAGNAETVFEEARQLWRRSMGVRRGTYVPLEQVLGAVTSETRRQTLQTMGGQKNKLGGLLKGFAAAAASAAGSAMGNEGGADGNQPHMTLGGARLDKEGDLIMTVDSLIKAVSLWSPLGQMYRDQSVEVMVGAIEDFYESNKQGAELDEVLQLTQKVNYRVKKLSKLARRAHEKRDLGPVEELQAFSLQVEAYLDEVKEEREKNTKELESLQAAKQALLDRLVRRSDPQAFQEQEQPEESQQQNSAKKKTHHRHLSGAIDTHRRYMKYLHPHAHVAGAAGGSSRGQRSDSKDDADPQTDI